MNQQRIRLPLFIWAGWVLAALFLQFGPPRASDQLQLAHQDLAGGLLSVGSWLAIHHPGEGASPSVTQVAAERGSATLAAENRELRRIIAQLQAQVYELSAAAPLPVSARPQALLRSDLVETRVIGRLGNEAAGNIRLLVALGKQQGLTGTELVLGSEGVLVDGGHELGLAPDQLLTAGRGLFGRAVKVGRWTTQVQPISDPDFRTAARIIRRSPLGAVLGPRGILAGTGTACRMSDVPATEAVAVGDEVYTDNLVSPTMEPIFCGKVTRVDVTPTSSHWSIDVEPLLGPSEIPARLQVLRTEMNSERVAADARPASH